MPAKKSSVTQPAQSEHSQLLPGTAPPPYSELPEQTSPHPAGGPSSHPFPSTSGARIPSHPSGPTAFHSLPVPNTPHTQLDLHAYTTGLRAADRRARYRFCGALFWGFVLWIVLGAIVGGVIGNEVARNSGKARRRWEEERGRVGRWLRVSGNARAAVAETETSSSAVPPPPPFFAAI
ncbi:RHTO0S06e02960g1_1 [Rhodotorula toruloides]|uniref:RHTO0S06e02960g1_1 n=1 Tax=Rhodotorula toruloides TaxID=5286 RepID=A0A061AWI7_RHOTO|nr:hypothetical protein OF846_003359 [Rhodotorula toruloides]CDR41558.1 RHTO0S06e02960g1_1 [Rhodotorula toruloides]